MCIYKCFDVAAKFSWQLVSDYGKLRHTNIIIIIIIIIIITFLLSRFTLSILIK